MLIDKYTKHSIFSLPQIFGDILSKRDLDDSEFVNMYMNDVNNPLLSSHVFSISQYKTIFVKYFKTTSFISL